VLAAALSGCGGAQHTASAQAPQAVASPAPGAQRLTVGRSVRGRPIVAYVVGSAAATRRLLVVGCVHGNETAGEAVTQRLRRMAPPPGARLWIVPEFNPDGCSAHNRQNARGVDLNRNSPWHWARLDHPGGTFYSGPGPLSEPESVAINRLVRQVRPGISIWYHQHATLVDASGGDAGTERRYARLVRLPFKAYGRFPGSITSWQNSAFPGTTAFVVELPAGNLSPRSVVRNADAVMALAAGG
jgi:protein MpaA